MRRKPIWEGLQGRGEAAPSETTRQVGAMNNEKNQKNQTKSMKKSMPKNIAFLTENDAKMYHVGDPWVYKNHKNRNFGPRFELGASKKSKKESSGGVLEKASNFDWNLVEKKWKNYVKIDRKPIEFSTISEKNECNSSD